ncbi:MAG: archaellin/type IV pilin N-terminal domain-containing protein [Candidatus Pacearchaeota archaeon]
MKKTKKAVSPVIATVLLVVVAIALFMIIFFWLKGFQRETIMKQGTAIENICPKIRFDARKAGNSVNIINTGDVPIQQFEIVVDGNTIPPIPNTGNPLLAGETVTSSGISCTESIKIIPILRGQTSRGEKNYACEAQAQTITC